MKKLYGLTFVLGLLTLLNLNLYAVEKAADNERIKNTVKSDTLVYVEDFHNPNNPDDTDALQSAINYVSNLPQGGTVLLQNKVYRISRPVKISKLGVGIKGEKPG